MDIFQIKQTKHTPEVTLDLSKMTLCFKGQSIPEDVSIFYAPLVSFIDINMTYIRANKQSMRIILQLEYFNSATLKFLVKLFNSLIGIKGRSQVIIDFYYDEDDDDFYETGNDISTVLDIPINLICKTVKG